jgi:hypothetical protein
MRIYDRDGKPITIEEWSPLLANRDYVIVARSHVGDILVSTVWLGLDHHFHFGPGPEPDYPVAIFETMCFGGDLDQEPFRYATEEQALKGHAEMVATVKTMLDVAAAGGAEEPVRETARPDELT